MGGVETDIDGRSTLPGLHAAGEVACTGVHGANRLASNSLLEGLVFGARAADAMLSPAGSPAPWHGMTDVRVLAEDPPRAQADRPPADQAVQALMWSAVGLIRHADTLKPAVEQLAAWQGQSDLALVGYLIAKAALRREESRGGHFRADFPRRDDLHWRIHIAERLRG
jgi:L-aspartate oxidase